MTDGFLNLLGGDAKVELAKGQVLFSKGDHADHFYVVHSGQLDVVGEGGQVLQTLGPDQIVGEMALIDGAARSATVRSVDNCVLIEIDEKRFLRMVSDTPYFALRVMRVMADRLRKMNDHAKV